MTKKKRLLKIFLLILVAIILAAVYFKDDIKRRFFEPTESTVKEGVGGNTNEPVDVVAQDLNIPWEIAFLPGGDMLVTERPGTLKRIGRDKRTYTIQGVEHTSEGGLLGLALHPDFGTNRFLYLYMTTRSGTGLTNRVERYRFENNRLSNKKMIISNIPGASIHDGGRIAFGPDKMLYITTGDAGIEQTAQDTESLAGKILRVDMDGVIPKDNPFGNAVYSYGHRNPQGLAWDDQGRMWTTEHGPASFDELNLIKKGANYGWPNIKGDESADGMEKPAVHSGPNDTWAPASLAYKSGSLFFGGLRGETLYEAKIEPDTRLNLKAHFRGRYGRIRAATIGPDGGLYIGTSNTDGRGRTNPGDDKIIRISPANLR